MPTTCWFFYDEITTDYQINPNTECVAIAAAKNANNEWGLITELRFTTPESTDGATEAPSKDIKKRLQKSNNQRGVAPKMKGIKLTTLQ